MKSTPHLEALDRLAALAARAEPPPLDDLAAHRMVERALANAALGRPARARALPRWLVVPALACAAVVVAWLALRTTAPAPDELLRVTLPTGDRLVGTHGARFDIAELAPASRRFRVHAGTMLFDVAHAAPSQRFEVTTPHVVVIARGTVFSVTTDARASRVHVYEGAVDVVHAGTPHRVNAGESWPAEHRDGAQLAAAAATSVRDRARAAVAGDRASGATASGATASGTTASGASSGTTAGATASEASSGATAHGATASGATASASGTTASGATATGAASGASASGKALADVELATASGASASGASASGKALADVELATASGASASGTTASGATASGASASGTTTSGAAASGAAASDVSSGTSASAGASSGTSASGTTASGTSGVAASGAASRGASGTSAAGAAASGAAASRRASGTSASGTSASGRSASGTTATTSRAAVPTSPGAGAAGGRTTAASSRASASGSSSTTAPSRDEALDQMLARARAHVAAGRFDAALAEVARAAAAGGGKSAAWRLVEGDALRGLGRAADAAAAFETVARLSTGAARVEAAYSAAYLRFHRLRDGAQALVVLDVHAVDGERSALAERGLGLRVQILAALGRTAEAAQHAERYLARFPRGGLRAYMRATVRRGSGSGSPAAR